MGCRRLSVLLRLESTVALSCASHGPSDDSSGLEMEEHSRLPRPLLGDGALVALLVSVRGVCMCMCRIGSNALMDVEKGMEWSVVSNIPSSTPWPLCEVYGCVTVLYCGRKFTPRLLVFCRCGKPVYVWVADVFCVLITRWCIAMPPYYDCVTLMMKRPMSWSISLMCVCVGVCVCLHQATTNAVVSYQGYETFRELCIVE